MNPEQIVRRFCEAAERRDSAELAGFFTDDAVYHNIPIDPVQGPEAIRKMLDGFLAPATSCTFELRGIAVNGGTVMTERVDRFTIHGKEIALPVMGVFELRADGKIRAWRDYFDLAQFTKQMS
jgi:limonene-1,2-epoxide hydrolase